MKITYANLKGFKRFHLGKISELEAEFTSPVVVITGLNGCGKSSYLRELNPLPSVRTDYERDGRKEIHIHHDGHDYKCISDFSNRVSPHSFIMDNVELNCGHTTDMQMELVAQHFGITPAVRDLIYNKTAMCSLTKANRKTLFLSINPLDLSLINPAFKQATADFKYCRDNLQRLYARKAEIESNLLNEDVLNRHIKTKEELSNILLEIDKVLYGLEQHITNLRQQFATDLEYRRECVNNNRQLVDSNSVIQECRRITRLSGLWSDIPRGDAFHTTRNQLNITREQYNTRKSDIEHQLNSLSNEIDEYHKHLDATTSEPASKIERELRNIEQQLKQYVKLPEITIPVNMLPRYERVNQWLEERLLVFRNSDVKMQEPKVLEQKLSRQQELKWQLGQNVKTLEEYQLRARTNLEELKNIQESSRIPDSCVSPTCGLRAATVQRITNLQRAQEQYEKDIAARKITTDQLEKESVALSEELTPYVTGKLLEGYQQIYNTLKNDNYLGWRNWDEELLQMINTQPMKIAGELELLIKDSRLAEEKRQLEQRKQELLTEMKTLVKSSNASLEFLTTKLKEKEEQVKWLLDQLNLVTSEISKLDDTLYQFNAYAEALAKIQELKIYCEKGERALIVTQVIDYWSQVGRKFTAAKADLSEKLRKLETIVQEQQVLRKSYESEIISQISVLEKDKKIYDLIAQALSPNSGFPHKSMVRYLNALINNVNYFLSQVWTYKLHLLPISMEQDLDYGFKIEVSNDIANDINVLSEGQTEMINLVWVLTILLQMKMLNKIPLYADELGRAFDSTHRFRLLTFLNQLIDNKFIEQMFLVSHYSVFTTGFTDSEVICLSPDSITDMPQGVNNNVRIVTA